MGVWDVLSALLPDSIVHIERNETDITLVNSGEGHQLTAVDEDDEGTQLLQVDLNSLSQQETSEVIRATWKDQEEIFVDDSQKDKKAIENASENSEIDRTLDFFRPFLDERFYEMLRAALYLRDAWEGDDQYLTKHEMGERKSDIAERYGQEAWAVCNLATAGYFDEEGYVYELFDDFEPDEGGDYRSLFQEIVENQPFTVFVGGHDSVPGIVGRVKQRIRQKQQYRVEYEFVDIRGIGDENRRKIQTAVRELEGMSDSFEHETISETPDMVERIYLTEVAGLVDEC